MMNKLEIAGWKREIREEIGHCEFYSSLFQHEDCTNLPELTHHIDSDYENNARENIMILCHRCHTSYHNDGKKHTEETRGNMGEWQRGKVLSEGHKRKISKGMSGSRHHMHGKNRTEETRKKISESVRLSWVIKALEKELNSSI